MYSDEYLLEVTVKVMAEQIIGLRSLLAIREGELALAAQRHRFSAPPELAVSPEHPPWLKNGDVPLGPSDCLGETK